MGGLSQTGVDASAPVVLYTLLHAHAVHAYLLAVKSFLRFCPALEVVVQSDGTLDEAARRVLEQHVPGVRIIGRDETERAVGRWLSDTPLGIEVSACGLFVRFKLLSVLALFPRRRVILFDSDLLFLRRPQAVVAWTAGEAGAPAVFYGCGGATVAAAFRAMGFAFPRIDVARFNSGFFGFENVFAPDDVAPIFRRVAAHDPGLLATAWDAEQAIWAVLLNRFDDVLELDQLGVGYHGGPWDRYRDLARRTVYTHFVGSDRFRNFSYPRLGWRVIRELRRAAPPAARASCQGVGR